MEMILISPNQLKVMMDKNDMIKYELDPGRGALEQLNRRDALRRILRRAKDSTGFDFEGGRVTVRMFPSRDGGCEMFVTLLSSSGAKDSEESMLDAPATALGGMAIYSFASLSDLLAACKRLLASGYSGDSFAFRENAGAKVFLAIEKETPLVSEMGGTKLKRSAATYINEYCELICKDAVGYLADFA